MDKFELLIKSVLDDPNTVIVYRNDPDYDVASKIKGAIILDLDRPVDIV